MARRYEYKVEWEVAHRAGFEWRGCSERFDSPTRAEDHAQWLRRYERDTGRFRNIVLYRRPVSDWKKVDS